MKRQREHYPQLLQRAEATWSRNRLPICRFHLSGFPATAPENPRPWKPMMRQRLNI